ncbi:hypothetical protein MKW94_001627 [Papaver nudicaule]|uniref:Mediator of RNA polymerase II transcription subunit 21 n=1 Tax=Papaver nudicaule TaxID=74823 RepID=A0AA41W1J1_PAPNU|nr:hypothetical protein [Papaver nudicaule]
MDIISQLQEQANTIASLAFNTFGTLQRDAPPVRLSPNYPEPPANTTTETPADIAEQPKLMSAALVKAAKQISQVRLPIKNVPISASKNVWHVCLFGNMNCIQIFSHF